MSLIKALLSKRASVAYATVAPSETTYFYISLQVLQVCIYFTICCSYA